MRRRKRITKSRCGKEGDRKREEEEEQEKGIWGNKGVGEEKKGKCGEEMVKEKDKFPNKW